MSSSSESRCVVVGSDSSSESDGMFLHNALQWMEDTTSSNAVQNRRTIERQREIGHQILLNDWFVDEPKYDDAYFRKKFRMEKSMFLKIVDDIEANFPYFRDGFDAHWRGSFKLLQKVASAVRQLATGNLPDEYDEYLHMAARTGRDSLDHFCDTIIKLYGREYLRRLTQHDVARIFQAHEERHHMPRMLGSIDCTHVEWLNGPRHLKGQYTRGDHGVPTIMLEITASQDLWIWHAYFGAPGSNNDINVLNQSDLYHTEGNGTALDTSFVVNGQQYKLGYYLTDGIYNKYSTFVKAYPYPTDPKEKRFKKLQEGARKDVERAFGVLKGKWKILRRPLRPLIKDKIGHYVYVACILHNMVIKGDGRAISPVHIMDQTVQPVWNDTFYAELLNEDIHHRLRYDLTDDVWAQDLGHLND
uniref:protein ALP1-like n=1 Tax=Erigeron canadensis TaxID=72917 RepID=UPI001CB8CDA4|nr:protein ALP1-like [Erigeron canadensis]